MAPGFSQVVGASSRSERHGGSAALPRAARADEYVFATLPNGTAVWAMSRDSGQQWWYQPEHADDSRAQIAAALGRLDELPMRGEPFGPHPVQPAPIQPDRHDLAGHRAGHEVLAEVHRLHGTAAWSAVGGLPGVLPAEIATFSVGFVGEEVGRR